VQEGVPPPIDNTEPSLVTVHACVHPLAAVKEQWIHDSTRSAALEGYSGAALLVELD
jgi:hypothetical protein